MTIVLVTHPREKLDQYFGQSAISALRTFSTVRFNPEARDLSTEELITLGADCDVIIAYRQTPGTASLFRGLPRLSAFMRCAVDIRTIDVDAASAQGILITQASAGYVPAVAEWAIAAMIDLGRGLTRYAEGYHHRHPVAPFMGRQLRGSTLGVIGYGQIGRYLADLALALGMQVCVTDPLNIERRDNLQQLDLDTTLSTADFVVCLAPANAQTENLMNAQAFARMKPGAFFINASRGDLVDERALLQSLESGHLAGCALDVGRAPDQMPTDLLARHPLVLATPHVGGLTMPAIEHQALETVEQLASLIKGEIPLGAVNAAHATRLSRLSVTR